MKHILILTGDAGEGLEIYYMIFRLQEEGYHPVVAAITDKPVQSVIHDFEPEFDTYVERPGYRVPVNETFDRIDPTNYDGLLIPGGRAPEYIRNNPAIPKIVKHFFESHKPVGAICHGVQVIAAAQAVGGRTVTCYGEMACDMQQAGAKFQDTEVVVDGNLVTSRAWLDNPFFMREYLKLLANGD